MVDEPDRGCVWVGFQISALLFSTALTFVLLILVAHYLVELWNWLN